MLVAVAVGVTVGVTVAVAVGTGVGVGAAPLGCVPQTCVFPSKTTMLVTFTGVAPAGVATP